jgi:hypothetical protein
LNFAIPGQVRIPGALPSFFSRQLFLAAFNRYFEIRHFSFIRFDQQQPAIQARITGQFKFSRAVFFGEKP